MNMYIEIDEGIKYNRSTGKIEPKDRRMKRVELTITEMKIVEVLFDYKWHTMQEIDEKTGLKEQSRRTHINRLKNKIKKYIEIKIDRRGKRYKCERIKKD